jgi:predicted dithiol-disulfide oxidoreductase (DUF899 family)
LHGSFLETSGWPPASGPLAKEKELARARDPLNLERRQLPMVEIVKAYEFEGPEGKVGLLELFDAGTGS